MKEGSANGGYIFECHNRLKMTHVTVIFEPFGFITFGKFRTVKIIGLWIEGSIKHHILKYQPGLWETVTDIYSNFL